MADSKTVSFRDLLKNMKAKPAPVGATAEEWAEVAQNGTPLIVTAVYYREVDGFGGSWDMVAELPNGEERIFQMWANVQRDATLTLLVEATKDLPVSGITIRDVGRADKPFYVPVAI